MPYTRESIPDDHSEFGGGPGLIDPVLREDRLLTPEQQRMEIMFTNPADASVAVPQPDADGVVPAPGTAEWELAVETRKAEIELENDPATTPVPRVVFKFDEAP